MEAAPAIAGSGPAQASAATAHVALAFLWLAFGRAVAAGDRAWRYGPGNSDAVRGGTLAEAIAEALLLPWRSFFVRPRPEVLALEADTAADAGALRVVAEALRAAGIEPVLCRSGRAGGLHLWARLRSPGAREAWDAYAAALAGSRAVVRREGLRPPCVPHRLRLPAGFEAPASAPQALAALTTMPEHDALPPGAKTKTDAPRATLSTGQRLTAATAHRLATGDATGLRDTSGSGVTQAVLNGMAGVGWSEAEAFAALMDSANAGGAALRARMAQGEAGRVWFARSWHAAVRYIAARPPVRNEGAQIRAALAPFLARIVAADATGTWKGRGGASRWRVAVALYALAHRAAVLHPDASLRRLSELTGLGTSTVRRALLWLRAHGWIRPALPGPRARRPAGEPARSWVLEAATGTHATRGREKTCVPVTVVNPVAGAALADAFTWGGGLRRGLGPASLRVLWRLASEPAACPVEALAGALGMTVRRVKVYVARLAKDGFVVQDGTGWRVAASAFVPAHLEAVARRHGTAGLSAQRRERHRLEREARREAVADRVALLPAVRAAAEAAHWPFVTMTHPRRGGVTVRHVEGRQRWRLFLDRATASWLREALRSLRPASGRIRVVPMPGPVPRPAPPPARVAARWRTSATSGAP